MTAAELTALLVLCTATSFTPGPNTTLSTALAANLGLRQALRFVLSVPVGWGLLFSLCAAGVGALVLAVPMLRLGVQATGVGYLLWLALKLWRANTLTQVDGGRLQVTFWQGVLLQFLNIKAWMLALTVVAGWLAGRDDALTRFAVVLPVLLAFGLSSNLTYALIGSLLRRWLADAEHGGRRLRWFNRSMALVLVVTAVWMATF
ncbi:MAG: LysE family translocator [Rhodoferax sp.]|jgi:threonine/homoserine/homoserine lactone efflux protein|uniref:LysE family translocator n=1 Tax=Rhodoferax sp. TaxID=50421 RepID=UPI001B462FBC|nr:LysE family translocator [Rhodoferax sp.]MBP9737573.1 LysE family translocator [Rhodoferax sp.]